MLRVNDDGKRRPHARVYCAALVNWFWRPVGPCLVRCAALLILVIASAEARIANAAEEPRSALSRISIPQLFADGGAIGYVITVLSVAAVALIIAYSLTIRRSTLIPHELPETLRSLVIEGQIPAALEECQKHPSVFSAVVAAGLNESAYGFSSMEKAMEDTAVQASARLYRRIESLALISSTAPLLGLMGTVWGMILAFMEFEAKANPTVSELAPGVYKALVTTLFGLIVAIPATVAFAWFRNQIDELLSQVTAEADGVFHDWKRSLAQKRRANPAGESKG